MQRETNPWRFIVLSFLLIILVGTIFLMLPVSSQSGKFTDPITALFTATSATCVTGLVVVDTGTYWSLFGQIVILLLIQLGGISYMTLLSFLALLLRRQVVLHERIILQETLNSWSIRGVMKLARVVLYTVVFFEGLGALLLFFVFIRDYPFITALKFSIFHSISAFCNAGFDLLGGFRSLTGYVDNPLLVFTITSLIIFGGIGFVVIYDLRSNLFNWKKITIHSKIAILTTIILIILGTLIIGLLEWRNPGTMGPLSIRGKILSSYFQSVTPRTAGFNTLNIGNMRNATLLFIILLMFIGASPGGTGGGIKTVTFTVLISAVRATLMGYENVEIMERKLYWDSVRKAWALFFLSIGLIFIGWFTLLISENFLPINLLFEVVSAFGTVGLSTGITPSLSTVGRIVIILVMYLGRVGLVVFGLSFLYPLRRKSHIELPYGEVSIG
ncbi:MAG TPA: TrkH family potassium uptake protein [bacterium]|nr:TrkH family potassium uptake protein [bacterium]HOL54526.1 TrkH family potassium uptake protein [bacterium]HPO81559.1 TrkH family potassium uptake protein [bacterium]HRR91696.1 TrkH family potassium uptake protein [bacterium]